MKIRYEVIRVDESDVIGVRPIQRYVFDTLADAEKSVAMWVASSAAPGIHFHIMKRYEKG